MIEETILKMEAARLAALHKYNILDTEPDQLFDELTELAAQICSTPIAAISLVDQNRQWFKSKIGISVPETLREHGFCPHAIVQNELFVIPDATTDERFAANPFVAGDPHIRFYAGMPLVTKTGEALGTICVVDYQPRNLTEQQKTALRSLGRQVMSQLELRLEIIEKQRAEARLSDSEHRYRQLVDLSPDAIFVHSEGKIVYANPAGAYLLGASNPLQLIGGSILDFIAPNYKQFISGRVAKVSSGAYVPPVEEQFVRLDGTIVDVEVTGISLTYEGKPAVQAIARDITDHKRAKEAIQKSEERFRLLFERMMDGFYLTTPDGKFVDMNPALIKMFGYSSKEEMMQVDIKEELYFSIEERESFLRDSVKEELDVYRMRRKDGSVIWVEENGRYLRDKEGNILHQEGIVRDITERKQTEEALQKSEANYRNLIESSPAIIYAAQPFPPYATLYVSPNVSIFGFTPDEWYSHPDFWINLIFEEDRTRVLRTIEKTRNRNFDNEFDTEIEYRITALDKTIYWIQDKGRFTFDQKGNRTGWQGVMLDITKTKALEEQLRQAQKLESVGRLAGGIAHDFNNMLTAISGYSALTLRRLKEDDPLRGNLEEIKKAADRSAELTYQLLAFSRQQILQPKVIYLNQIISDTSQMLERVIGEDIDLITVLNTKAAPVKVDPGQITQVIMNLVVNARDAMPRGGRLTIETANVFLDPAYTSRHPGVLPGAYVMLAVCDTGIGMDSGIQKQIFEPFFTTKEVGQGTGLGLATVYGIVKQSGGNIEVFSEEGAGTTFKIFLPRVAEPVEDENRKGIPAALAGGTETILLVEDEEQVRNLTREILNECGYTVIEAQNGVEALSICSSRECKFHLLMTDVVMPQMGGRVLADTLSERSPDLKVLFTSGYTDDAVVRHGIIETNTNFIQKPFTPEDLSNKLREILDNIKQL